jgi:hypothetical protein
MQGEEQAVQGMKKLFLPECAMKHKTIILALAPLLVFMAACTEERVGELQYDPQSVELGAAKSVQATLGIAVGELQLSGGAKKLLEGETVYNVLRWKPQVKYEVAGDEGKLSILQPEGANTNSRGKASNKWHLSLNDDVPLRLEVNLGVGKSELELGSLKLNDLKVQTGVGETTIDLTGGWKNDLHAVIRGGIGKVTVRLPREVGVRVDAHKGIGSIRASDFKKDGTSYSNDAFGKSKVTLHLEVEAGIGEIRLELN